MGVLSASDRFCRTPAALRHSPSFCINDAAHKWFHSYVSFRKHYVRRGPSKSSVTYRVCGVPQGSVLGPILFVLYTVHLLSVIESHGLSPHLYADDTQVYGSCRPSAVTTFTTKVAECVEDATSWMKSKRLQPNPEKTEVLWCATTRRQHQLPTSPLLTDGCSVSPVKSVPDLGIYTVPKTSTFFIFQITLSKINRF